MVWRKGSERLYCMYKFGIGITFLALLYVLVGAFTACLNIYVFNFSIPLLDEYLLLELINTVAPKRYYYCLYSIKVLKIYHTEMFDL